MTADRDRSRPGTGRIARFLRLGYVRRALQPERLRRRARANPWLTVVLVAAAILLYFGIWRVEPHQMVPDEVGSTAQPFTLVEGRPGMTTFEKGGNFHIWLLVLVYLPVLAVLGAYWTATGQLQSVLDGAREVAEYQDGGQWDVAEPALAETYNLLVTAGRFVSATAGVLAVLAVFLLGRRLYDRNAGLLAGATLAVTLGFTLTAKYATEDVVAASLLVWALVPLARHYDTGEDRWLLYSAGMAGLAISAKATAGILVFPIAYLGIRRYEPVEWLRWSTIRELLRYPTAAVAAYVVTTPSLLVNPALYVDELLRYFNVRTGNAEFYLHPDPGPIAHFGHLVTVFGVPLFALVLVATVATVVLVATDRLDRFTAIPLGLALGYLAIISSWGNVQYNRVMLVLPLLALFVGLFAAWATDAERPRVRRVAAPAIAVVLVLALVYTASGALVWSTSRADATEWTHDTLDEGAEVTTLGQRTYLPEFPDGVDVDRTVVDPMYEQHDDERKERAMASVRCHRPEYLVLTSFHYERYFQDPDFAPDRTEFYESLLDEEGGYEILAEFGPADPNLEKDAAGRIEKALRLEPPSRNTNNPKILVLERAAEPQEDCPGLDD